MAYIFVTRKPALMSILSGGIFRRAIDICFQRPTINCQKFRDYRDVGTGVTVGR